MGKKLDTCSRVMTHHRSVAHIVEGLGLLFLILLTLVGFGFHDVAFIPYVIYGVIEIAKGILLLAAIVKESRRQILVYLVIHIFTILVKHGLLMFFFVSTLPYHYHIHYSIMWLCFVVVYFAYEWFMVFSVIKIRQSLQSSTHKGDKQVQFHYKQHKDEAVDIIE